MNLNLQFDEDRRADIEQAWTEWWAGELPRPIVIIANPRLVRTPQQYTWEFLQETPIDEMLDQLQPALENVRYRADALPSFMPAFGTGIIAAFLGSKVETAPEQITVWFEADESLSLEDLHFTYDADNVWWRRMMALTARAVERWGDRVSITTTTLGGIIDTLARFRTTQQLLCDLYEAPDQVIRLTNDITDLWIRYHGELYDIIEKAGNRSTSTYTTLWSPGHTFMHESDFICMISPQMFERFVMPNLDRCFRLMNHAFYHLDGKGAIRHLDRLLSLENLRGIQWNPAPQKPRASEWMPLLKRIRDGGKLCEVSVDPAGARDIVRALGGRGFCFNMSLPPEEVDDFLAVLAAEDANAI